MILNYIDRSTIIGKENPLSDPLRHLRQTIYRKLGKETAPYGDDVSSTVSITLCEWRGKGLITARQNRYYLTVSF